VAPRGIVLAPVEKSTGAFFMRNYHEAATKEEQGITINPQKTIYSEKIKKKCQSTTP